MIYRCSCSSRRSRPGSFTCFAPLITANWDASDGNEWTVPLGLGITRTAVFNGRPMNIGLSYFYNVEHPDGGAGQQLRLFVSLLYPEHRGETK